MKKHINLLFLTCLSISLMGQVKVVDTERFSLAMESPFDRNLDSPEDFLGYKLGAHMTEYERVTQYFNYLAEASPKVQLNQYGETYEGRPLINLVITSEENMGRLDELQERHLELLDADAARAEEIISNDPVFTSFSYNIHGNEFSSTEAAMQVAYHLAAAENTEMQQVLDKSVIIMYVCINPDGRNRYAYWYNSMARLKTPGKEPRDLEHYAPWPNGRTNHYWFDLNRDWIWGVHPESRGQVAEYQKWMPQVHVDYHEQGYNSNYFTMPGTTPRNKLLPDTYEAWTDTFGMANVKAFNEHKLNYFTRTSFDFFYPAYGSSYPSVMGGIGMLTEQGGIGGGRAVETNDGYILTLRQRIFDHYTTSLATIQKSAERREALLRYSYQAWQPQTDKSGTKAYCFLPDDIYTTDVVNILLRNGVEVARTTADARINNAIDYRSGKAVNTLLPKGSYVVSTDQPRHLLVTSLMERNLAIEDSVMYDMATWAAPLAYNLQAFQLKSTFSGATEPLSSPVELNYGLEAVEDTYAYVIDWNQRQAPKALAKLWQKGYRVRSAEEAFTDQEGRSYEPGALIVLVGRNLDKADQLSTDMQDITESTKVQIQAYQSGRMKMGMDLASSKNRPIKQPRVAMLIEPPFNTYTSGQLYFLFDQETELPVERIRASILRQTALPKFGSRYGYADLQDYDVLVLPGGGSGLGQMFKKEQLAELKDWVQRGGVIVATEGAAEFFTKKASGFTEVEMKSSTKDSSDQVKYLAYEDREDYFGKKRIPGTALNAQIDATHPLAFGVDEQVYTLKFGADAIKPNADFQTVGFYHKNVDELAVAGYASKENLEHLAGGSFAGVMEMGQGKVVFLLDNTQYRMFWRGPSRMMQNAVMLLPGF
ncbi:MAG TPA: M14 family metallopeptidase [Saprospiraceae bacterium]|nr:M14 family metallopeptidase [Saprospiraceae bacterium]